ncbi:MAG: DUF5615 family PIN-like protein [Terriglobia bacterium]
MRSSTQILPTSVCCARDQGFTLVSKDADFHQRTSCKSVWLRVGNCSTEIARQVLADHHTGVRTSCEDQDQSLLICPHPRTAPKMPA